MRTLKLSAITARTTRAGKRYIFGKRLMATTMAPRTALLTSKTNERTAPIIWKILRGLELILDLASFWLVFVDFFDFLLEISVSFVSYSSTRFSKSSQSISVLPVVVLLRSVGIVKESITLPDFLEDLSLADGVLDLVDADLSVGLVAVDFLLEALALVDLVSEELLLGLTSANLGEVFAALVFGLVDVDLAVVFLDEVFGLVELALIVTSSFTSTLVDLSFGLASELELVVFLLVNFLEVDLVSGI